MARPTHPLFLLTRLRAIWCLLTQRYFVLMTASPTGPERKDVGFKLRYNVAHKSFRYMVQELDPVYEENEGQAAALNQAEDLLNPQSS